jgi:hypothetical protein
MNEKSPMVEQTSELLILDDGSILAHNLTPAMAELLADLDPNDAAMRERAKPPDKLVEGNLTIRS